MKLFIEGSIDKPQRSLSFMPDTLFIGKADADSTDTVSEDVIKLYAFDSTGCECRTKGHRWSAQWANIGLETVEGDKGRATYEELRELIVGKLELLNMVTSFDGDEVNVTVDNCEIIQYKPSGSINFFYIDLGKTKEEGLQFIGE